MAGLLLAALLAGCAAPSPGPSARVSTATSIGADGDYRGTATRFRADTRACPRPGLVSVIVFDYRFQYRWDHDTWLNATIASDGVAEANDEGITLHGRLYGPRLEGDVTNGPCSFHFTLRKTGA